MTAPPSSGPPPPPPFPRSAPADDYGDGKRSSLGAIYVPIAISGFLVAMFLASVVTGIATAIGGGDFDPIPVYALFFGTLAFQIMQAAIPWLVSKYNGLGIEKDWGFTSSLPADIFAGFGFALCCLVGAQLATIAAATLTGLEDTSDASNTDILVDNKGSLWLVGIILLVVVGAPLAEELLFRGLILRTLENSFGAVIAVVGSSLLFALPHYQLGATWQETTVLLSALGVVGLVLGIATVVTGRLGPAIIAHFLFNGAGTLLTLVFPDVATIRPF